MNNNEKPIVICLFGFMAVGKLTIAEKLNENLGLTLFHNHMLNDFIGKIFPRGSKARGWLIDNHRLEIVEGAVQSNISLVMTHAYSSNYTSSNGVNDLEYMLKMEELVSKHGGIFYGVHLIADEKIILERISNESRKKYNKLIDKEVAVKVIKDFGEQDQPNIENLLTIDTGKNSPEESVQKILDFIK